MPDIAPPGITSACGLAETVCPRTHHPALNWRCLTAERNPLPERSGFGNPFSRSINLNTPDGGRSDSAARISFENQEAYQSPLSVRCSFGCCSVIVRLVRNSMRAGEMWAESAIASHPAPAADGKIKAFLKKTPSLTPSASVSDRAQIKRHPPIGYRERTLRDSKP